MKNWFSPSKSQTGLTLIKRSTSAEQEIHALEQQILVVQNERDNLLRRETIYKENLNTIQRQFEEYKKRSKQEFATLESSLKMSLFKETVIPLLDELHRTLLYAPKELWPNAWFQGLTLTIRTFHNLIRQWGVQIYYGKGKTFDAYNYEAVLTEVHPEIDEGTIIRALLPGYWFSDDNKITIIRRAQVVVSAKQRD
jgi:molecular chaperone GrpE (heat shock protein)